MLTIDELTEKVELPPQIDAALKSGFDLAISISGGKDSDAMARVLTYMRFHQQRGWRGRTILLHSNLGRAEHRITPRYIARFAGDVGLRLHIIEGGDLVDVMKARKARLEAQNRDVPFWPSAKARYCTSDLKRAPISKFLRHWSGKDGKVICAIGLRAGESISRASKPIVKERPGVHTKSRSAYDWLPIHSFTIADVWNALGYSLDEVRDIQERSQGMTPEQIFANPAIRFHPAYALRNDRLSCALCIFGSLSDLRNGAYQNPEVYREYVQMEIESGYSFQPDRYLGDAAPDLLSEDMLAAHRIAGAGKQERQGTPQPTCTPVRAYQLPLL